MRFVRLFAMLLGSILVSVLFVVKSYEPMKEIMTAEFPQVEMNCTDLLDEIDPPFPAILIDRSILRALKKEQCQLESRKILVAVNVEHLGTVRSANFPKYDILYYEKPEGTDYLRFLDTVTRIIPRILFNVYENFSIPSDSDRFFEYWERSEFVKCLGLKVQRENTTPYLPPEKTIQTMSSLVSYFISFNVYPFLNGGSLLGWYRECGIIPHTLDVDFAAFIGQYKPALLDHLLGSEAKFYLRRKFGRPNDSYEFTLRPLRGGRPSMDLFWMYSSENESWVGGTGGDGSKYKYSYPRITKICAGDLWGHIFWVPCDPEKIIKTEYGPKWYDDHPTKRFSWQSSHFNVKKNGRWTAQEMKEVYRIY